jgi:hypothetical protein
VHSNIPTLLCALSICLFDPRISKKVEEGETSHQLVIPRALQDKIKNVVKYQHGQ